MHSFTFNGHSSEEFGIRIERFPDLNRSERKYKAASVAGRNGNIYQMESAWEEVTVSYQIFAGERQEGAAVTDFTEIVEWLNSADDYAELTDTYDPTHYRLAVFVDELEIESQWHTFGKATIRFRCRPQRFLVENPISVSSGDTITNNTNHIANPIITLTGKGVKNYLVFDDTRTLLDASNPGTTRLDVVVSDPNVYTFVKENSSALGVTYASNAGTLNSMDLRTGTLDFSIASGSSGYGIGLVNKVQQGNTYTISGSVTSGSSYIIVWLISENGYNEVMAKYKSTTVSGSGTVSLTFETPIGCGYVLIGFFKTAGTYSSVMLNAGSSVETFSNYVPPYTTDFTINDIVFSIYSGDFDTAVIDCEKEDFTIDGMNSNSLVSLTKYNMLSPEYLHLNTGTNTVSFPSNRAIVAVSIEPRFWEL